MAETMTPAAIRQAMNELAEEIGPHAELFLSINRYGAEALSGGIYPEGIGHGEMVGFVKADDWPELFEALRVAWSAYAGDFKRATIRKMALAVIQITADTKTCTDAALRGAGFDQSMIDRFGDEACAMANEMAANGPFSIEPTVGANAA